MSKKDRISKKATSIGNRQINPNVALAGDPQHIRITFRHYVDHECQIDKLTVAETRACLNLLKAVGAAMSDQFHTLNIRREKLKDSPRYKPLKSRLPPDIDLREDNLSDSARLFYDYAAGEFHVLAIRQRHY